MRLLLALLLLFVLVQPQAAGRTMSGGSFGGRAGFRSSPANVPLAPRLSSPAAPHYSAPAYRPRTWSAPAPSHTVIIEHHHLYTGSHWIDWDRNAYDDDYYSPSWRTSGGGCSNGGAARDAGAQPNQPVRDAS